MYYRPHDWGIGIEVAAGTVHRHSGISDTLSLPDISSVCCAPSLLQALPAAWRHEH